MSLLKGTISRFTEYLGGDIRAALRQTYLQSLANAQVEPSGYEMTRAGRRFILGNSAAITGIANVTALPTTAAQWIIWNNSTEKSLIFEEIGMYNTLGTPGVGGVLLAAIASVLTVAAGSTNATGAKISNANGGDIATAAVVVASKTISTPAAPNWFPIAQNNSPNVGAFPGSGNFENRQINGRIIVRPGQGLSLNVIGLAGTTPLWAPFAQWLEYKSDNE